VSISPNVPAGVEADEAVLGGGAITSGATVGRRLACVTAGAGLLIAELGDSLQPRRRFWCSRRVRARSTVRVSLAYGCGRG
jgi:hypothetical protein